MEETHKKPDTETCCPLGQHRITVLMVDDQALVGQALAMMFETEEDIDFHFCQDPRKAIATAEAVNPTVILQDLLMPGINGLDLVQSYRSDPATREVPLIVLSGKEDAAIKAKAFAFGANDYMVKFPHKLEVLARVRYHSRAHINLLQRNEAMRQLELANRFIRQTFGRYLSESIVDAILASPEGMQLGGEKRNVTIMLSDLRGFTSTCESISAEEVVAILNTYLKEMTDIILKHGGVIDEFIGDAILAIFGAPMAMPDHAQRAVACGLEMQLAMERVNEQNRAAGYPEVVMGIGINTGDAVVGNIGSPKRMKYGVVGRNVNLTSRIESYSVGGQVFISETTRRACGDLLRIDDEIQVTPKGFKEPLRITEVGGIGAPYDIALPRKELPEMTDLQPPLGVRITVLEGKHVVDLYHEARILALNPHIALMETAASVAKLADLRMILYDDQGQEVSDEVYGKVTAMYDWDGTPGGVVHNQFILTFTSLSPAAEHYFKGLTWRGLGLAGGRPQ